MKTINDKYTAANKAIASVGGKEKMSEPLIHLIWMIIMIKILSLNARRAASPYFFIKKT
jgi:hypothetical protein